MIILAIETSCDDTCISVVKIQNPKSRIPNFEILSNVVSSQVKLHAKYGGVYPSLAKREHQRNLVPALKKALKEARLLKSKTESALGGTKVKKRTKSSSPIKNQKLKIDAIGVTVGPGLEPCLWQGVNFAKEIAQKLKKPLIPVNHIEAHILANWLNTQINTNKNTNLHENLFPAVCLVVSGGHTQLILMKGIGKYKLIGETRDDAAGECFDKAARILGLGYPGGPVIAAEAAKLKTKNYKLKTELPRPMINQKNYDFSFSGLKTAVLYDFKSRPPEIKQSKQYIQAMAVEIQQAIVDVLIKKTTKAAKDFKVKSIILGGGVAANEELRKQFQEACSTLKFEHLVPPKKLCTDNAAMVAVTAYFRWKLGKAAFAKSSASQSWQKIEANANLRI